MDIVVTGSIAYDYLMRFPGSFRQHILTDALHQVSLSFLVDDMTKHWGGVAANIAFSMAQLGLRPRLFGTVGRDFADYRHWLESAGVDCSLVRQHDDVFTASFFCNTDNENNQIASFYTGAMAYSRYYSLSAAISGRFTPDLVVISPNDPQAMSNYAEECRQHGWRFVYDPSQQIARMDGESLRRDMCGAHIMVINEYESILIRDKTGLTLTELINAVDILIVTHGKNGSRIHADGQVIEVPIFETDQLRDPTGAGDAYRAGFLAAYSYGLPLRICGEVGTLCAAYVLEQVGTQNHRHTISDFIARYREQFNDQGLLDVMLKPQKA
ncbi:MAG: carbohydrate kinase family protein [Anaerolineae bacterium]|nr:carbohydrate kinase family protein [Anaerolineae bacterium]MDW8173211.1 carbohydrate kinase family protein [Anaerolineae bacterium]